MYNRLCSNAVRSSIKRGRWQLSNSHLKVFTSSLHVEKNFSSVPTVNDLKVNVTFVDDVTGKRTSLIGLVGQTLVDVCRYHKFDLLDSDFEPHLSKPAQEKRADNWVDDTWGEGPQSAISHVYFSDDWYEKIEPPLPSELKILSMDLPPGDTKPTSR